MAAINNDWAEALKEEYRKPYYRELYKKINEEYKNYKLQAGEKALSKSEWITQKSKS